MQKLVAERKVLFDAVHIRRMHRSGAGQGAPALGVFGLQQMALARARTQNFSAGRDLKSFGR